MAAQAREDRRVVPDRCGRDARYWPEFATARGTCWCGTCCRAGVAEAASHWTMGYLTVKPAALVSRVVVPSFAVARTATRQAPRGDESASGPVTFTV